MLPDPIKKFVDAFASLPGIGPRQATRLAYHIKERGPADAKEIAQAVELLAGLKTCSACFSSFNNSSRDYNASSRAESRDNLCSICSDPQRNQKVIAVVEKETDLISLEKTKKFSGRYLVLGDLKKDGILNEMQKLRLKTIKSANEIVLALSPTTYGDLNASIIAQELKEVSPKITRLGRGIPTGGEIEFADEDTLGSALDNRS